jgi:Flp pilus assembly pilin Flp
MASHTFRKLARDQRGATMVEYAILLFLVLVVAAAVYRSVGKKVRQSGDMTAQQFT